MKYLTMLSLMLLQSGCLHFSQQLELLEKGGTFRIEYSLLHKDYERLVKGSDFDQFFDPDKGATWYEMVKGVQVTKYRVFEHGERIHVHINGRFSDTDTALKSGRFGDITLRELSEGKSLSFNFARDQKNLPAKAGLVQGMKLDLTIKVEGKIVRSTAPVKDRRKASWSFNTTEKADALQEIPKIMVIYK